MFEGFDRRKDGRTRRRLALTTGASLILYVGIGGAVLAFAGQAARAPEPDEIDVSFAPPPPPPVAAAPPPPPPPVPKGVEVKKVARPLPRPALAAPEEMPTEKPAELDPASAAPIEIGDGAPGGTEGGTGPVTAAPAPAPAPAPPTPTVVRRAEPINLPETATPPTPAADNVQPEYPADARAAGREGQVILKIVVSERGEVTRVDVLRGDEPFAAAAIAAVKRWRYSPALVDGQPAAVFRIVKIPFRIKA